MTNPKISRRLILQAGAVAGPTLALIGCSSDAQPTGDAGRDTNANDTSADAIQNADIATLNALLSAEWGAIAAYTAGAGILQNPAGNDPGRDGAPIYLAVAGRFLSQHQDHAMALSSAITSIGGTPIAQSSVQFVAPNGFSASVFNVLKLACNAEKAAAIAYNNTIRALQTPQHRFLASSIEGDETQHFMVLYALLRGIAEPGPNIAMVEQVVPRSFVSTTGNFPGLNTVAALSFTA